MIITSSNVGMTASRKYSTNRTHQETLRTWGAGGNQTLGVFDSQLSNETSTSSSRQSMTSGKQPDNPDSCAITLTDLWNQTHPTGDVEEGNNADSSTDNLTPRTRKLSSSQVTQDLQEDAFSSIRSQIFDYLMRMIFGVESDVYKRIHNQTENLNLYRATGGSYEESTFYQEQEWTSFSTEAQITCGDGRSFSFQVNVEMSRSFTSFVQSSVSWGDAPVCYDPLVIQTNGNFARVEDQTFYFDIDCDGSHEKLSRLDPGNAFLALDKNEDGKINDGSELFGAQSGDGFGDLAKYDSDGNGWIDEADPIFSKLKVWYLDSDLKSLKEMGIGAIYLGSQDTQFSLTKEHGRPAATPQVNAYIRKTGFFLYESGMAGTIQQLDFVKQA